MPNHLVDIITHTVCPFKKLQEHVFDFHLLSFASEQHVTLSLRIDDLKIERSISRRGFYHGR